MSSSMSCTVWFWRTWDAATRPFARGERGRAAFPISREALIGAYLRHQLVRIFVIPGEPEKAIELLEPLLEIPYFLSSGRLRIDPNFAPLRGHQRYEELAGR